MEIPTNKPLLLIVDDEPDIAELLSILLGDHFKCDISREGQDALKKIAQFPYEALITDLEMPEIPGLE